MIYSWSIILLKSVPLNHIVYIYLTSSMKEASKILYIPKKAIKYTLQRHLVYLKVGLLSMSRTSLLGYFYNVFQLPCSLRHEISIKYITIMFRLPHLNPLIVVRLQNQICNFVLVLGWNRWFWSQFNLVNKLLFIGNILYSNAIH